MHVSPYQTYIMSESNVMLIFVEKGAQWKCHDKKNGAPCTYTVYHDFNAEMSPLWLDREQRLTPTMTITLYPNP